MRGVLHTYAAAVAVGAGLLLLRATRDARAAFSVGVFAASLVTLFVVSATYHRIDWAPRARAWMRRADHAAIFSLIAGTYTPVAVLAIPPPTGERILVIVWCGAALGILQSLFWVHAPKVLVAALAIALGWATVPYLGEVRRACGDATFSLLLAGGIAYSVGAIVYAAKRPALWPATFGYHELFHLLTLVGAGLHFVAVARIVVG